MYNLTYLLENNQNILIKLKPTNNKWRMNKSLKNKIRHIMNVRVLF